MNYSNLLFFVFFLAVAGFFCPHPGITLPCRVTCRFSLRGLIIGEGQGTGALLNLPPVTFLFLFLLGVGVKEGASRAKVGSCVDADRFVRALVGEGH